MSNEEVIKSISSCPIDSDASALKLAAVERMLLVTMLHEALSGAHTLTPVVAPSASVAVSQPQQVDKGWRLPKVGDKVRYCVAASGTIFKPSGLELGDVVEVKGLSASEKNGLEPSKIGDDWKSRSTFGLVITVGGGDWFLPVECFEPA